MMKSMKNVSNNQVTQAQKRVVKSIQTWVNLSLQLFDFYESFGCCYFFCYQQINLEED